MSKQKSTCSPIDLPDLNTLSKKVDVKKKLFFDKVDEETKKIEEEEKAIEKEAFVKFNVKKLSVWNLKNAFEKTFNIADKYIMDNEAADAVSISCKFKFGSCSTHHNYPERIYDPKNPDADQLLQCCVCSKAVHLGCFASLLEKFNLKELFDDVSGAHLPFCGIRCHSKKEKELERIFEKHVEKTRNWSSDARKDGRCSLDILVSFMKDQEWYNSFTGGKKGGEERKNTDGKTRDLLLREVQKVIFDETGLRRTPRSIEWKISNVISKYRKNKNFLSNTGQGVEEGSKTWLEVLKELAPYHNDLDAVLSDKPNVVPLYHTEMKDLECQEDRARIENSNSAKTKEGSEGFGTQKSPIDLCGEGVLVKSETKKPKITSTPESYVAANQIKKKIPVVQAVSETKLKKKKERSTRTAPSNIGGFLSDTTGSFRGEYFEAKTKHLEHLMEHDKVQSKFQEMDLQLKKRKIDVEEAASKTELDWKMKRAASEAFEADSNFNYIQWKKRNKAREEDPNITEAMLDTILPFKKIEK